MEQPYVDAAWVVDHDGQEVLEVTSPPLGFIDGEPVAVRLHGHGFVHPDLLQMLKRSADAKRTAGQS